MFSDVTKKTHTKNLPYPKLMIDPSDQEVRMYVDECKFIIMSTGQQGESGDGYNIGDIVEDDLNKLHFVDYKGVLSLSNVRIK